MKLLGLIFGGRPKLAIKRHVAAGAETNKQDDNGITPLCWAAMLGHKDGVEALLEQGADVDSRNQD